VEKLQARIEDGQEQAFSAGHETLVASLEAVRARLEAISDRLRADTEKARLRTEHFLRALIGQAHTGVSIIRGWRDETPLTPADLPDSIRDRFVAPDGTLAAYAFPAESIYNFDYLDRLMTQVLAVSPQATGFPSTHLVFSRMMVESFTRGTLLAVGVCLVWLMLVLRSVKGFILASLPLLIGGGWMLGLMALGGLRYNFANVIAVPLVVALAVDYGVWFSHRWRELKDASPLEVTRDAGKVIALAAGTELAGLGGITLASYRGVSSLGIDITLGLLACLVATLVVAPAIGQLIDSSRTK
jgi:predicted RND superfamily exporter protein